MFTGGGSGRRLNVRWSPLAYSLIAKSGLRLMITPPVVTVGLFRSHSGPPARNDGADMETMKKIRAKRIDFIGQIDDKQA